MKKHISILFIALILFSSSKAQEDFSFESNKVTQYEIGMAKYEKDPEAEALVIYEKGNYRFVFSDDEGVRLKMTIETKIKILAQAGEKYATFEIPLYASNSKEAETIEDLSGTVYNFENGKFSKTDFNPRENVNSFEEKINSNWTLKKFTLPDVQIGSVLEIKYTINTPFFVNMRTWEFQKKIPVIYSLLKYKAIPYYEYTYYGNNITRLDEQSSTTSPSETRYRNLIYKEVEHSMGLKNIPAFRDEEFISSNKDYMMSLVFQLSKIYHPNGGSSTFISTWEELSKDLLKHNSFGKYITNARKEAKKILPELALEGLSDKEKISKISEYVKQNFNWDGFYGKYSNQKPSNLLKTKKGNVAELNLFLTGLLQEAGLDASPIILSTRDHGKINKNYPFLEPFNYVIALVSSAEKEQILLDATEPMLPENILPLRCTNTDALIVAKTPKWTITKQSTSSYLQKTIELNIDSNQTIEVNALYSATGYMGYKYRAKYMGKEQNLIEVLKNKEGINVDRIIEVKGYEETNKPFHFSVSFNNKAEGNEDKMFINPFANLFSIDNPFKQTNRRYPIDINEKIGQGYISTIKIPENYTISSLPKSKMINSNNFSMNYQVENNNDSIKIELYYNQNNQTYPTKDYLELKEFHAQIISKLQEMIVLKKKEE